MQSNVRMDPFRQAFIGVFLLLFYWFDLRFDRLSLPLGDIANFARLKPFR
jgi:hypothetical protein